MGSVATEKERGTAGLILTKPAGRGAFLVAKLVAIGGTLAVAVGLAAAAAWFYTLVLFEALSVAGDRGLGRPPVARDHGVGRDHVPRQHADPLGAGRGRASASSR